MDYREKTPTASIIRKLREEQGLSQKELAKRAGMTATQLCKIELGHNSMTESTLRRVAEALGIGIGELLGESSLMVREASHVQYDAEDCECCYVPILASDMSGRCFETICRLVRDNDRRIAEAERALGIVPGTSLQLVFPYGVNENASELLARNMRFSLGVGNMPIQDLVSILEMRGVRIAKIKRPNSFQSMSFYNLNLHTLTIVLNSKNTDERNTYRLAYELGAAIVFAMSSFKAVADEGHVHRLLRRFTTEFLMPEETVRMDVAQCGIEPDKWSMLLLNLLKRRFAVSAEAYALRLEMLGLITPSLRVQLRDELRQYYVDHPDAMEPSPSPRGNCETRLAILSEAVNVAQRQERKP